MTLRELISTSIRTALAVVATSLAGPGVASAPSAEPGRAPGVPPGIVDGNTAHELARAGVKIVDVRTPAEFAAGHVPGAVNIPYDQLAQRHAELGPPSTPLLLYCRTGHRSGIARGVLAGKGFTRIWDLQAYDRWVASEAGGASR